MIEAKETPPATVPNHANTELPGRPDFDFAKNMRKKSLNLTRQSMMEPALTYHLETSGTVSNMWALYAWADADMEPANLTISMVTKSSLSASSISSCSLIAEMAAELKHCISEPISELAPRSRLWKLLAVSTLLSPSINSPSCCAEAAVCALYGALFQSMTLVALSISSVTVSPIA
eukprot:scaffold195499_cov31-Tisochrysis_lutea.AAC.2